MPYYKGVNDRAEILREVMSSQGITQSELSRISGVSQPSISQMLSGEISPSDEQVDRLLGCLGFRLRVRRDWVEASLQPSERRSWLIHREISRRLERDRLEELRPLLNRNLEDLRRRIRGEPHTANLDRWEELLRGGKVTAIKRVLTGLDRRSIEMREVSPFKGVLSESERREALAAPA